jgi:hypothetical protein
MKVEISRASFSDYVYVTIKTDTTTITEGPLDKNGIAEYRKQFQEAVDDIDRYFPQEED